VPIRAATGDLYDWVFLDFSLSRTSSELKALVKASRRGVDAKGPDGGE